MDCCYDFAFRQFICQNGIRSFSDNVFTNVKVGSLIPLNFGYEIEITDISCDYLTFILKNNDYIPELTFRISNGNYKSFDLPKESGTLQVIVTINKIKCEKEIANCNNCYTYNTCNLNNNDKKYKNC